MMSASAQFDDLKARNHSRFVNDVRREKKPERKKWIFPFVHKNYARISLEKITSLLFVPPMGQLHLSKLNPNTDQYDSLYEKSVRRDDTQILFTLDDTIFSLVNKDFGVIEAVSSLEDTLLSGEFYCKAILSETVDLNVTDELFDRLLKSFYLLIELRNVHASSPKLSCIEASMTEILTLVRSDSWRDFEKSKIFLE